MTQLYDASEEGDLEKVRSLVEQGMDKEATDETKRTPLYISAARGHLKVVQYLVEQGANMEAIDYGGYTPLERAMKEGHFYDRRVSVGARGKHGR